MAGDNENIRDVITSDDYSLESILAEYKGSAYINGDRKTPAELLNEQTDKIIMEATRPDAGNPESRDSKTHRSKASPEPGVQNPEQKEAKPQKAKVNPEAGARRPGNSGDLNSEGEKAPAEQKTAKETDQVILFFENYKAPVAEPQDSIVKDVEKAIEKEFGPVETRGGASGRSSDIFGRTAFDEKSRLAEEEPDTLECEVFEEPDLRDAMRKFADGYSSVSLRCIPATLITLVMIIFTFTFEAGMALPFGVGHSQTAAAGALVISMLVVMMFCVDIIIRGAVNLVHGTPNLETLILFSCAFSFVSGAFTIINDTSGILPYCAVSALSLTSAAYGEKYKLRAFTETLKTASGSVEPYGVQAEYNNEISKSVLKKAYNRTDGFYNNLMSPDITEMAYRYATPILLAAALVLSASAALAGGHGAYFLHILSALLAAAAPFSAVLSFSLPFRIVARSIRKSGAAIAGWGGADDICYTDGACVTDDDLFPPGTLSFNGMKLYDGVSPEKAIRYTASLVIASGSGLSRIFTEALSAQGMKRIKVEDFTCYEGGVGALIRGEQVVTGSAALMNLLGVRVPEDVNMKNAVFTTVDGKLIAMFAINYVPVNSVQSALISMLKWRINLFFAVRDFNVTPLMVAQKFKVSLEDIESFQAKDSYNISDSNSGKDGRMAAVLTREGLGPFAEAVTGGKLLKMSALVAVVLSIASAAIGVIFMCYMCWTGAFMSAKPGNLMVFMLSMLAIVLVVCGYARLRR